MSLRAGYRYEQSLTVQFSERPDAKEATAAFLEKRKPVCVGLLALSIGRIGYTDGIVLCRLGPRKRPH